MFLGQTEVVGVENGPNGALKVYVGHRSRGEYVLIEDEQTQDDVRRAWANTRTHVLIPSPPAECVFTDAGATASKETEA